VLEVAIVDFPTTQPKRPKEEVKVENLGSGSAAPGTLVAAANKVQTGGFGDPNGIAGPGNPNRAANINQAGSPLLPGGPGNGNGSGGAEGMRGTVAEGPNKQAATGGGNSPVSILNRPHPVYSDEARTHRIEGDVILDVVFLASGQVQVNSVVTGLGHGLDEAAVLAAKQIHFKPATRDGHPVDFPAHVRISFRVAA
jgi:TonB family protein